MAIILELKSQFSGFSGRRWRKKRKIKIETQVKLVKEYSIVEMSGMGEIRVFKILLMGLQVGGSKEKRKGERMVFSWKRELLLHEFLFPDTHSLPSFSFKLLYTITFILQLQFLRCFRLSDRRNELYKISVVWENGGR
ncbi:hypothetical protein ACE6H2_007329 [Prunus campanulata]